jgi:NADP-dependent 3-hydroxy acid dehydrogenase YdfG
MDELKGKVALVTGGSRGIGEQLLNASLKQEQLLLSTTPVMLMQQQPINIYGVSI